MSAEPPSLIDALAGDAEIEALLSDDAQVSAILAFEAGLARAQADAGLIGADAAEAIVEATARFTPDWSELKRSIARDGVIVPALISSLRAMVPASVAADVHRGATSQDAVDTALVLQLRKVLTVISGRLELLAAAFASLGEKYGAEPLMAHTRMQAAAAFTVADKIASWSAPVSQHRAALVAMEPDLLAVQLGGPVGDRRSFRGKGDAIARALARNLDLRVTPPWHTNRQPIVAFGGRLAMLSGSLGKFGMDVALLAQSELGAIKLSGAGGSSSMAHKNNPVAAEILVALARETAGLAGTLHHAMVHENERSGAAWTLEWLTLPRLIVSVGASLRIARRLAGQISFPGVPARQG